MFVKRLQQDLTTGNITTKLWLFALPFILGNLLQQLYNLCDTWIVAKYIGDEALAAVGSSYTLMNFLTSIILGMCLGSGAFFAITYGQKQWARLRNGIFLSFTSILLLSLILTFSSFWLIDIIIALLQVPKTITFMTRGYLVNVFWGLPAIFFYHYGANLLQSIGDSLVPLIFLAVAVAANIGLDILFVAEYEMGVAGAAIATVIAQYASGIGLLLYGYFAYPKLRPQRKDCVWQRAEMREILSLSGLTCLQQSVMNFGILMVQGIINRFGTMVMSAFAVAVKIDTIAYMPVQDFGNAFSTLIAQNYGAGKWDRIDQGIRIALLNIALFCCLISALVWLFAQPLMEIFIDERQTEIIRIGVQYLRIEGAFYIGIGVLFMLYGYFRAVQRPQVSLVLTVISLGTRVLLADWLSQISFIGVIGIWAAIPIGWVLADLYGVLVYWRGNRSKKGQQLPKS